MYATELIPTQLCSLEVRLAQSGLYWVGEFDLVNRIKSNWVWCWNKPGRVHSLQLVKLRENLLFVRASQGCRTCHSTIVNQSTPHLASHRQFCIAYFLAFYSFTHHFYIPAFKSKLSIVIIRCHTFSNHKQRWSTERLETLIPIP